MVMQMAEQEQVSATSQHAMVFLFATPETPLLPRSKESTARPGVCVPTKVPGDDTTFMPTESHSPKTS